MPIFAAGFVLGNVAVHGFPVLPGLLGWGGALAPLIFLLGLRNRLARFCGAFAAAFLWTLAVAGWHAMEVLPAELEGRDLKAAVRVVSIPQDNGYSIRFDAEVLDSQMSLPQRLRLSIYRPKQGLQLRPGDVLNATLRLKRPNGYMNPGGFDYERYLFSQHIGATGYIRNFHLHARAAEWSPSVLRYRLYERLKSQATLNIGGVIALTLGERGLLDKEDRGLLFSVGIGHLFAISGLHIALVFGFIFLIFRALWARLLLRFTLWPAAVAATAPAFLVACTYAWLAGFTIPTQRALIMLACVVAGVWLRRRISLTNTLPLALVAVITRDPLSTLSATFWLSFAAVGFIALYFSLHPWPKRRAWIDLQIALPLALLPAGFWFFGYGSLAAAGANIVAVPLVSFLILPLSLLAVLCAPLHSDLCALFAYCAGWLLEGMWRGAALLAEVDFLQWFHHPPTWSYLLAVVGIVAVMLVRRWQYRVLAVVVLLLPLASDGGGNGLPKAAFEVTFLDVGQGLSVVVETRNSALLYDTGPIYRSGFNAAEAAIIPYLHHRGIQSLDKLIVSHGDSDHAGGVKLIAEHFKIGERLGSGMGDIDGFKPCLDGAQWLRDGVYFEMLHPTEDGGFVGNEASCVLKISAGEHSLLLTGDIEQGAEISLLKRHRARLKSSLMLVPHHGSLTSSTPEFVAAVQPRIAVVTSGYRNRFKLPKREILQRYFAACVKVFNTADTGTLRLRFVPGEAQDPPYLHRRAAPRYWRRAFAPSLSDLLTC